MLFVRMGVCNNPGYCDNVLFIEQSEGLLKVSDLIQDPQHPVCSANDGMLLVRMGREGGGCSNPGYCNCYFQQTS